MQLKKSVKIKQDILAPEYQKVLKLSGYHPSEMLKIIPGLLLDIYKQQSPALFEDEFKWDVSDDPLMFFVRWRIKDGKDRRTTVMTQVAMEGFQSKKDLSGKVAIAIRSWIETDAGYGNPFGQAGVWFLDKIFYKRHRMQYINEARRNVQRLEDAIKNHFGILERRKTREVT